MQVRSLLIVMMNITFNLNVAARFFIVAYAHDFVKNGQFEVRLFYQIYWSRGWPEMEKKIQKTP